jgi:hypothetical protein
MLIRRMFIRRKLGWTLGFTVLLALAFGVSCTGFFPPNSLSAVSIQPPSPQIQAGATNSQTLEAWGTYQDGSRSQITNGVEWTSSDSTVLTIGQFSGIATGEGTGGSATVTASAQGLSATASATVYLGNITGFTLCTGTFGSTTCGNPLTWTATASNGSTPTQTFVAQATNPAPPPPTLDFTVASTWTVVSQPTGGIGSVSCTNSGISPETCTVQPNTTPGIYPVTVTYGTTNSATLNITVN